MQLKPYLETFGPENVLPVFVERLKESPQEELERVAKFIGCDRPVVWQERTGHRHASKERLRESAWRDVLVHTPALKSIRRNLVPKSVRTWVKGLWQMKDRPQLSDSERAEVEARLDQDLALLGEWLGREMTCETFRAAALLPNPTWVDQQVPKPVAISV